jgi:hypothetical protein
MNATRTEVTAYAAAVRAALADLPAGMREELLEDLEDHLHEVAEEEGSLTERLGPPSAYAEELRSSAGLSAAGPPGGRTRPLPHEELAAWGRRVYRRIGEHPWGAAVIDFLPELRPAWWVLRGYIAVQLLAALLPGCDPDLPFPELLGSQVVGLAGVVGAVVLSVRLTRRHLDDQQRRLLVAADIALGVIGVISFFLLGGSASPVDDQVNGFTPTVSQGPPGLLRADGSYVQNIYPFDAAGRPLKDVFLYDQDGKPVNLGVEHLGLNPAELEARRGVDGTPLWNVFPVRQYQIEWNDQGGVRRPLAGPNLGVPKLAPERPLPTTPEPVPSDPGETGADPWFAPSPPPASTGPAPTGPSTAGPSPTTAPPTSGASPPTRRPPAATSGTTAPR